ncbi:MAG: nucleotidyl transferase AbiEii/AbiGii toxin family protein [Myxococcaceae bacterium]
MIRKEEILERARSWGLRVDVVEKDYVLGWLLAALARNPEVKANWIFKGGTCLKKCYFETYRFSEDLDFSLRPAAEYAPDALIDVLKAVAQDAHELSGIEFPLANIKIVERRNKQSQRTFQGKVPYRGPLARPQLTNILFDLTQHEVLVDEPDARSPFHPYPDDLPDDLTIAAYSIEELFAEKTRALFERTRPRDLYDVVQIVENHSDSIDFELAREFFHKKCAHKRVAPPGAAALVALVRGSDELKADWVTMLAHQLQVLPPIDSVLGRISEVLAWLDASAPAVAAQVAQPPHRRHLGGLAHGTLVAPPSTTYWGAAPIEQIRFAGANRLMVSFTYNGKHRLAEPYSLRRAAAGHVNLFAWVRGDAHVKQFKIDEIIGLTVTGETFSPQYAIELTGSMIPSARSSGSAGRPRRPAFRSGVTYIYRCRVCGREFKHERNNAALRVHQTPAGYTCSGRRGFLERVDS